REEGIQEPESQLRRLAEKSLSLTGIFLVQDGFFRYVNTRFAQTFAYGVEELTDGKRPQDLGWPDQWSDPARLMEKEPNGEEQPSAHTEFRGITKSGQAIYVEL